MCSAFKMHVLEVRSGILFDLGVEFSSEEDILKMNVMVSFGSIFSNNTMGEKKGLNTTKVNSGYCKHADNIIQHCMEEIDIYICFLLQSLIALEHEHQGQRMSLAGSVNNINARNSDEEEEDQKEEEIGRVAGWAVNFEKLLKDGSGLVVFTVRF